MRLGEREPEKIGGGGASGPQQCLFATAAVGAGPCDGGSHQACENRSRESEEQEHDAGVEAVRAGLRERIGEVVADDSGSLELRFEVACEPGGLGGGAGRIAWQRRARDVRVDLEAHEVRACASKAVEEGVPAGKREEQDVVRRRSLSRRGRRADGLEERRSGRRVDHTGDTHPRVRKSGALDRDLVSEPDGEVRGELLSDQGTAVSRRSAGSARRDRWNGSWPECRGRSQGPRSSPSPSRSPCTRPRSRTPRAARS